MTGRLYVQSNGELRAVDPESKNRPRVDCAKCAAPVRRQALMRDGDGGWLVRVGCHDSIDVASIPWRDLLGDLVLGPAFDPSYALVRRLLEPRP